MIAEIIITRTWQEQQFFDFIESCPRIWAALICGSIILFILFAIFLFLTENVKDDSK